MAWSRPVSGFSLSRKVDLHPERLPVNVLTGSQLRDSSHLGPILLVSFLLA
ncbi:MAG: hypothetical protein JWN63_664 [Candidatus Acidoferrum typicum]|jgi:hypothetical protein|nr:hypothetical protein [Candidatus Acidoferrum typicum]